MLGETSTRGFVARATQDINTKFSHDCLRRCAFFADFPEQFLNEVILSLNVKLFNSEDYIVRQGEVGEDMFFLYRGEVEVLVGPNEDPVAKISEGSVFGEIALFGSIDRGLQKRSATIRALGFCDCRVIHHRQFSQVLQRFPECRAHFEQMAQKRLVELQKVKDSSATAAVPADDVRKPSKERISVVRQGLRRSSAPTSFGEDGYQTAPVSPLSPLSPTSPMCPPASMQPDSEAAGDGHHQTSALKSPWKRAQGQVSRRLPSVRAIRSSIDSFGVNLHKHHLQEPQEDADISFTLPPLDALAEQSNPQDVDGSAAVLWGQERSGLSDGSNGCSPASSRVGTKTTHGVSNSRVGSKTRASTCVENDIVTVPMLSTRLVNHVQAPPPLQSCGQKVLPRLPPPICRMGGTGGLMPEEAPPCKIALCKLEATLRDDLLAEAGVKHKKSRASKYNQVRNPNSYLSLSHRRQAAFCRDQQVADVYSTSSRACKRLDCSPLRSA